MIKTILNIIWISILIAVFARGTGSWLAEKSSERKKETGVTSMLTQTANLINKDLPRMTDSETRLDTAIVVGKQLHFHSTMVDSSENDFDASTFTAVMRPLLEETVCTIKELDEFRKHGMSFVYIYHGKYGKRITSIPIYPSQCNSSYKPTR